MAADSIALPADPSPSFRRLSEGKHAADAAKTDCHSIAQLIRDDQPHLHGERVNTLLKKRPATFHTNFGLAEVTGNSVTVRVTLRFTYPAGSKVQGIGTASRDYDLAANGFMPPRSLVTDILGSQRDTVGDLRGIEADFQVVGGNGAVMVYTSSVDNGTNDSILRTD